MISHCYHVQSVVFVIMFFLNHTDIKDCDLVVLYVLSCVTDDKINLCNV